jgi:ankyrin repeat protein
MRPEVEKFSNEIRESLERKIEKFSEESLQEVRQKIIDYINEIASLENEEEIISILKNTNFGESQSNILHVIARFGDESQIREILELVADPEYINIRDRGLLTPLHYAAQNGWLNLVEILLERGALKNSKSSADTRMWTPCHLAAKFGHVDIVAKFFEYGVDKEEATAFGLTALHIAAENGRVELAQFLLDSGLRKDATTIPDNYEMTPLHYAVLGNHYDLAMLLIESGANKNAATNSGETALSFATSKDFTKLAISLLRSGCDRRNALNNAARNGNAELAVELLKYGANGLEEALKITKENSHKSAYAEIERYLKFRKNLPSSIQKFAPKMVAAIKEMNAQNLHEKEIEFENDVVLNAFGIATSRIVVGGLFKKEEKTILQIARDAKLSELSALITGLTSVVIGR